MASVLDVAAYILAKHGPMTAMKLQKLVYYSQAWHLAWEEKPLFDERIEAWANGPVVPVLYRKHRGRFTLSPDESLGGNERELSQSERDTIEAVIDAYGDKTARWLSELTHREEPWRGARTGMRELDRGDSEIDSASMHEYYSSLTSSNSHEV
jgi:uncharacterized phage-associated protein